VTRFQVPGHARTHRPKGWFSEDDPGGSDPLNWLNFRRGPGTLDEAILASLPAGFWKLNESSGTVAADSSGNGLDMTSTSWDPPTWGQDPGPPGQQTAGFDPGGTQRLHRAWAALSGDFTAEVWVYRGEDTTHHVIGQGFGGTRASSPGWGLSIGASSAGAGKANKPSLGVGYGPVILNADNTLAVGAWAHVAIVHEGTEWRMYVDGLQQTTTITPTYTPVSGDYALWLAADGWVNPQTGGYLHGRLSYAALFPRALTGEEIHEHFEAGPEDGKTVSVPYTIQPAIDRIVFAVGTGALTLPTAANRAGASYTLKNVGAGTVTVTAPGTEQIDKAGSPGTVPLATMDAVTVASNGIGWMIVGGYGL
jgi:hypothetical protein